jgi:hypothetical protein
MHKHVRLLGNVIWERRAHVAVVMAVFLCGYALWLYGSQFALGSDYFFWVVLMIAMVLGLAVTALVLPRRPVLLALGMGLIVVLLPGPGVTMAVQLMTASPGIAQWVWSFSALVAGVAVASYLAFEAAIERR